VFFFDALETSMVRKVEPRSLGARKGVYFQPAEALNIIIREDIDYCLYYCVT